MQDKNERYKVGPLPEVDENGFPLTRKQVQESYQGPSTSRTEQSYGSTSGTRLKEGEGLEGYSFSDPDKDNQKGGILYNIGKQYQERKQNLQKQTENDINRQRRMARYSAWGDFLKAIGNMAGGAIGGAAPVPMQYDPSRTLEAFRNVDRLRSELKNTDNDPMLSWLRNAELSRRAELERQKFDAENKLTDLKNKSKFENYSSSGGESVTQRSGVSGSSIAGTYENPAVLGGESKGNDKEPYAMLGIDRYTPQGKVAVSEDQTKAIIVQVLRASKSIDNLTKEQKKVIGKALDTLGSGAYNSLIPEEEAVKIANRLSASSIQSMIDIIMGKPDGTNKDNIKYILQQINDADSEQWFTRWAMGKMPGYEEELDIE